MLQTATWCLHLWHIFTQKFVWNWISVLDRGRWRHCGEGLCVTGTDYTVTVLLLLWRSVWLELIILRRCCYCCEGLCDWNWLYCDGAVIAVKVCVTGTDYTVTVMLLGWRSVRMELIILWRWCYCCEGLCDWNWLYCAALSYGGHAVAQWLRHCATNRKPACSNPDGVTGYFIWHNPSGRTMTLGATQPPTEMSTKISPVVKVGRCLRLTTLSPSCADCFKIWEAQPAGTLRAFQGL
jgi:hypothetical protein